MISLRSLPRVLSGLLRAADCIVFLRSAATTYRVSELSDEAGQSQPPKQPFSKGEIKANRLSQLNHKSTAIHRKELVAQS